MSAAEIEQALRERFVIEKDVDLNETPCQHPLCESIHAKWVTKRMVKGGHYEIICTKPRVSRVEWYIIDRTTGDRGKCELSESFARKKDAVAVLERHIAVEVRIAAKIEAATAAEKTQPREESK